MRRTRDEPIDSINTKTKIPVCVCGSCSGKRSISSVSPDVPVEISPDCTVTFMKKVLGNLKCPKGHYLIVFPSKSRPASGLCDICKKSISHVSTPLFYCPLCTFDLCIRCAYLASTDFKKPDLIDDVISCNFQKNICDTPIKYGRVDMFYCGQRCGRCFCRSCDGFCGPDNGCPCQNCILTAEMAMLSSGLRCKRDHLLTCIVTLKDEFKCQKCDKIVTSPFSLGCELCGYNDSCICCKCALSCAKIEGNIKEKKTIIQAVEIQGLKDRVKKIQKDFKEIKDSRNKHYEKPNYIYQFIPIP